MRGRAPDQAPWASMLVGEVGFLSSPDPFALRVGALPAAPDPLAGNLAAGAPIALLGIELHSRRRVRLNGVVLAVDEGGFVVRVRQSFGNCPRYIQARLAERSSPGEGGHAPAQRPPTVTHLGPALPARAVAMLEGTDTFFLASASARPAGAGAADGVDVSHRGGNPGFVRVEGGGERTPATPSVLSWPDFAGNSFFNTLGNLEVNPRAGLLVVDFASGDLLTLTGRTHTVWAGREVDAFAGAERLISLSVESAVFMPGAVPLRWSEAETAPDLEDTGSWR